MRQYPYFGSRYKCTSQTYTKCASTRIICCFSAEMRNELVRQLHLRIAREDNWFGISVPSISSRTFDFAGSFSIVPNQCSSLFIATLSYAYTSTVYSSLFILFSNSVRILRFLPCLVHGSKISFFWYLICMTHRTNFPSPATRTQRNHLMLQFLKLR